MMLRISSAAPTALRTTFLGSLGLGLFLGVWVVAAMFSNTAALLPPPWEVAERFVTLQAHPFAGNTLFGHLASSMYRFAIAYGLALLVGIPLGLMMGWFKAVDRVVSPMFNALRFIAPIAWVPFAVLWFGTGIGGPVLVIFAGAFPPCLLSAYRGARLIPTPLLEAARMLGTPSWRVLTQVLLPASVPSLVAGMRVAAGTAWQSLIGAELIVVSSGIGYLMVQGQSQISTVTVMSGMIAIGLVGVVIDIVLKKLETRVKSRRGMDA
jgi:NitT/TauT family transport system permease protein